MPVLEAHDVTKTFREGIESVPVLKGVSPGPRAGRDRGSRGPSGSGKTTLLTILGCMLTATSGTGRRSTAGRLTRIGPNDCPSSAARRSASCSSSSTSSPL